MDVTTAIVSISGATPYSQSRQHDEPKLAGESHDDFDRRTWRHKLNTRSDPKTRKQSVVIPAHGMHQCLAAAAKYSGLQIPGKGKATWTRKFEAGIMLTDDIALGIDPEDVESVAISANADGVRGSGKRVLRRFPIMPEWSGTFEIAILDPIITRDVFAQIADIAGRFIGVGRFRPEKGGTNGRFKLDRLEWLDARLAKKAA